MALATFVFRHRVANVRRGVNMFSSITFGLIVLSAIAVENVFAITEGQIDIFNRIAGMLHLKENTIPQIQGHRQFNRNAAHIPMTFDFIVVGAGPAGCVIANRLTERPDWNVLLLETGDGENLFNQIPALSGFLQGTAYNWNYKSTPQKRACFGMYNNECFLPRGRSVGGTSSINYMIYNRGNRRDFDKWAAAGNTGWSYKDVLPYFLKSERANLRGLENSQYHNNSGPMSVEDVPHRSKMVHGFIRAAQEAGLDRVDYNGASQMGVSYVQASTINGQRHSAGRAYIEPIRNRRNLFILTRARVTKVLIDPYTKIANGVEFYSNRRVHMRYATKEVILSAGAFNSPQLLMLSGVGPAQHLQSMGIPVIKDLPVGSIIYDHLSHFGPTFILNSTGNSLQVGNLTVRDVQAFLRGQGVFTMIGGVEALAFVKTPNSKEPADLPDAELIFVAGSFASDQGTGLKTAANLKDIIYDTVYKPLEKNDFDHFSFLIMHFHPASYGTVRLRSKNPLHYPVLEPNYFADPQDEETILQGIKEAIRICRYPGMQRLGARLHDIPLPGCEQHHFGSDNYWRCSIRTLAYSLHHQVASCKMGPASDPTAVVSPELKVHGIERLRVADTGVIPFPPTAHTNAASFMIGEKLSDMIRGQWN